MARPLPFVLPLLLLSACDPGLGQFPDFITANDDYYVTRIGELPEIDPASYALDVTGRVEQPRSFTLAELGELPQRELTLTVECIGNSTDGKLVSTAVWGGFELMNLLDGLGIEDGATGVRYEAADGYYATHTLDQLRNNGILGAIEMNGVPIPPLHGFPLRILNPGFYGVKQPAWVTGIEVIDMPETDYWEDRGWDVSPPMAVDTRFFFPENDSQVAADEEILVGGASFGGTRVAGVEVSFDDGGSWIPADIVDSVDKDDVWVFWQAAVELPGPGEYNLTARATDHTGAVQPGQDENNLDGNNTRPVITVNAG
jgi:hypothetical protein